MERDGMCCGTCLRSRYQKTFSESLVAVVAFDYTTREVSIELVQEDEVFKVWTCVRCGRVIHLESSQMALDRKLKCWSSEKDLCIV